MKNGSDDVNAKSNDQLLAETLGTLCSVVEEIVKAERDLFPHDEYDRLKRRLLHIEHVHRQAQSMRNGLVELLDRMDTNVTLSQEDIFRRQVETLVSQVVDSRLGAQTDAEQ